MTIPDWVKSEDWDTLRLGGVVIPGIATVRAKIGSGLDHKKPKGGRKATTKDDGDPLVEFDVELDMSHKDVVNFTSIFPVLRPITKNGARDPLKFEHPLALVCGVFNVSVGDIDLDSPESGGRMKISMKLVEWAPAPLPVKAPAKKPVDDAEDIAAFAAHADDGVAGSGAIPLQYRKPAVQSVPPIHKPSQDAAKNI